MLSRTRFRALLPIILSLSCYSAAWLAISGGPIQPLAPEQLAQLAVVTLAMAAVTLPAFLAGRIGAVVGLLVKSGGNLFIAVVLGPQVLILALLALPAIMVATHNFPSAAGVPLTILPIHSLVPGLVAHESWNLRLPAAHLAEVATLLVLCGCFIALGLLMRLLESRIERQDREIERLDFAFQKVADTNLELQTHALFAREEAMEQERRRVAGEIHDIIGYTLTNLLIQVQTALALTPPVERTHAILESVRAQASEGLAEARRSLAILRARESDRPRGATLFLHLVRQFAGTTGINIRTDFANLPHDLPVSLERIFYRIIQEGLTNSFRHGRASSVEVNFWYDGRQVSIHMRDYGQQPGFGPNLPGMAAPADPGIGLAGLRELVESSGGSFSNGPVEGGYVLSAASPFARTEHES